MDRPNGMTLLFLGLAALFIYPLLCAFDWYKGLTPEPTLREKLLVGLFHTQAQPESLKAPRTS